MAVQRITIPLILCVITFTYASQNFQKNERILGLFNKFLLISKGFSIPNSLHKQQKTSGLEWRIVATNKYENVAENNSTTPIWSFETRDTLIYNEYGKMVLRKTKDSASSWDENDLTKKDSIVYDGEWKKEEYNFDIKWDDKHRTTYVYYNSHRTMVTTNFSWNKNSNTWKPTIKDSMISSVPISDIDYIDYKNLISFYSFSFDSLSNSWVLESKTSSLFNEHTDSTVVFESSNYDFGTPAKIVLTFKSAPMVVAHISKIEVYEKDNNTNEYVLNFCIILEYDTYGNEVSSKSFSIDSTDTKNPIENYGSRRELTYDSYGNNTVAINSFFYSDEWRIESKEVNFFARLSVPVKPTKSIGKAQSFTINKFTDAIIINGIDLTAVTLFALDGKLIYKASQKAANQMKINLLNLNKRIPSGIYMVKIVQKGNEVNATIKIDR